MKKPIRHYIEQIPTVQITRSVVDPDFFRPMLAMFLQDTGFSPECFAETITDNAVLRREVADNIGMWLSPGRISEMPSQLIAAALMRHMDSLI